jgi:hypothetical protein
MGVVTVTPIEASALLFDATAYLEVEMLAPDMPLLNADDDALLGGANLCLAGRELLQFGSAVQIGPRRFRLSRLLRGRRGTEWAANAHVAGEPFLMIEEERLAPVPAEAVHVGARLEMLAIGIGDAVPADAELDVTGEALLPLPPVHLAAEPDGLGGRTIRWIRRSRAGWRWSDGVDAPLGEERERYELRLLDGSAVVRSVGVETAAWTYTAAMAAEDGAAGHPGPLTVEIRQVGTHAVGRAAFLALD